MARGAPVLVAERKGPGLLTEPVDAGSFPAGDASRLTPPWSNGRATGFDPVTCRFESCRRCPAPCSWRPGCGLLNRATQVRLLAGRPSRSISPFWRHFQTLDCDATGPGSTPGVETIAPASAALPFRPRQRGASLVRRRWRVQSPRAALRGRRVLGESHKLTSPVRLRPPQPRSGDPVGSSGRTRGFDPRRWGSSPSAGAS